MPILRQTGAKLSPGLGSYAVSADGTFPGGESLSVYTFGTAPDYRDELGRLATVYPTNFGTYITLPGKLAVGEGVRASAEVSRLEAVQLSRRCDAGSHAHG